MFLSGPAALFANWAQPIHLIRWQPSGSFKPLSDIIGSLAAPGIEIVFGDGSKASSFGFVVKVADTEVLFLPRCLIEYISRYNVKIQLIIGGNNNHKLFNIVCYGADAG